MAAGATVTALAVAGPAGASTATQSVRSFVFPVKATTTVRTQAIGNGGVWATVSVQRTATVSGGVPVLPFHCGPGAIRCFGYSALVKDTGSFRAYRFALTPNQLMPRFFSGPFFAVASWPKLFFPSVPGSARC
jgi:hypothetical protein